MKYPTPDLSPTNKNVIVIVITEEEANRLNIPTTMTYSLNTTYADAIAYYEGTLTDPAIIEASLYDFYTGTASKLVRSSNPAITRQAKRRDARSSQKES